MPKRRKVELEQQLRAHFATLRSPSLRHALKWSISNWQIYAAAAGSAMAMATAASTSVIGNGNGTSVAEPAVSARPVRPAESGKIPAFMQVSPRPQVQNQAPSIAAGGVGADLRGQRHDSGWRMGIDLRAKPRRRNRDVEGRLPYIAGRRQRDGERKGGLPFLCEPWTDQPADSRRSGIRHGCPSLSQLLADRQPQPLVSVKPHRHSVCFTGTSLPELF